MSLQSKVLRPGVLVGMSTSIKGNVDHNKIVLEEEHVTENGELRSRWETERVVIDAAEFEAATKIRSKARSLITGICAKSDFGYLCPDDKADKLEAAIAQANELCEEFNLSARLTEINFYTITGRIATDDVQAVRAIKGELNGLLEAMDAGIKSLNVDEVRAVAIKAKKLGQMLAPDVQARLQEYIDRVRSVAKDMAKAGDQAAEVVDEQVLLSLQSARTAFLDFDGAVALKDSEVTGRALDLDPEVAAPATTAPGDIDLGLDDEALTTAPEEATRDIDLDDMLG